MISSRTIEKILDLTDLTQLIGESVRLKPSGPRHTGCCPFHNERTPSFVVYPDGHYHCFGCGRHGNAISYAMEHEHLSFPEAVRWLGARVHVEVDETKETEKERTERLEREQLFATNETVCRNYREAFLQSKEAQAYAYSRWSKEFCDSIGIGYAPGGQFLVGKHHHRSSLLSLGLINERDEDFFRNRLVIPIRDRWHRVIAFTARRLDGGKEFKYLNSKESAIYKKGCSLFGADGAFSNTRKDTPVYLVEGAPDCMRLQSLGIMNTVACLGTSWTDEQFNMIKRLSSVVCFIPDGDRPKAGERFGPGLKAVFKAGKAAISKGFQVMVKQIPEDPEGKQDPDSYFVSRAVFDAIENVDFIQWYAGYCFEDAVSPLQKSEAVKEVAAVLSHVEDPTSMDMYVEELKKFGPGKRVWQKAVEGERQRLELDRGKAAMESTDEMDQQYGFHIDGGKYFSVTDKGSVYEWSNFTLEPLYLITDEDAPHRLFRMRNEYGRELLLSLDPGDLVSLNQFRAKVEQKGNFIWKATEKELIKLKGYLFKKTEDARPIKQLGWQKEEFFAFGNGVCVGGEFMPTDDIGIVKLRNRGTFFLPSNASYNRMNNRQYAFEHQFVHRNQSRVTLKEYTDQLFQVYGNNGRVGFSFFLATLFKDIVIRKTRSFPLLNLFGPKGSGKSDLGQSLMSFFIIENKGLSLTNSTMASLGQTVGAVSNALVHLEEYKNILDPKRIEFLKGLWDGIGRTRMSMDVSGRKETSAVDCGIIVSGQEMPTEDIALFTRLIFLSFPRSEFSLEEKHRHKKLMAMSSTGLTHLTVELLGNREYMERHFPAVYDQTFDIVSRKLENEPIEDRILKNWVTPLAVYRTLEMLLDIGLPSQQLLDICTEGIKNQSRETKTNSEMGSFWNVIQFLASEGDLVADCDYKIKNVRTFSSSTVKKAEWQENRTVLCLQKTRVFMLYKMRERSAGDNVIPEESLKYYLEQCRAFLGEKNVRYFVSVKGIKQIEPGSTPDQYGRMRYQHTTQRSYCFDYNMLKALYGLNLQDKEEEDTMEED